MRAEENRLLGRGDERADRRLKTPLERPSFVRFSSRALELEHPLGVMALALGGSSMNEHRKAVILFGIALAVVIALASVTTLDRSDIRIASDGAPAGTMGLAKPHQSLDRAQGQAIPAHR